MEQVKNLDDKRVCDQSKDGKVIVIRKKDCITRITANADHCLVAAHRTVGTEAAYIGECPGRRIADRYAGTCPVSYTHLDVYKRQPMSCRRYPKSV